MKLLLLSDISELHWKHGSGRADILLSCGDVDDQVILEAADSHGCGAVFAVKGNHDAPTAFSKPIVDLHLQVHENAGLKLGGLNGSWKYKSRGNFLYDQEEVDGFLSSFPHVDVFVSHNSPRGIHEREDEVHVGFDGLRAFVLRTRPKVLVHGHQHVDRETQLGETRIVGIYGYKVIEV